jgi:hypothetical protein
MPLCNIIDHRKRPYRFAKINCVAEPTCHDNSVKDADQAERAYKGIGYDEQEHVSLAAAVVWAQRFDHAVTLYIYDEDSGIYAEREARVVLKPA